MSQNNAHSVLSFTINNFHSVSDDARTGCEADRVDEPTMAQTAPKREGNDFPSVSLGSRRGVLPY